VESSTVTRKGATSDASLSFLLIIIISAFSGVVPAVPEPPGAV
jgi:hypothetical protein